MGQKFSTNLGLAPFPEIDQAKYPSIFTDSIRTRQALAILQSAMDYFTGAIGPEAGNWNQLDPIAYDRLNNLTRMYIQATENIAAGATVNFYNNSGTIAARNANATAAGKQAHAYSTGAVTAGSWGEFIRMGACKLISGLTPGATYYQSNTNGLISPTAGTIVQRVGFALSPTELIFQPALV
jgi:hypothetical protein